IRGGILARTGRATGLEWQEGSLPSNHVQRVVLRNSDRRTPGGKFYEDVLNVVNGFDDRLIIIKCITHGLSPTRARRIRKKPSHAQQSSRSSCGSGSGTGVGGADAKASKTSEALELWLADFALPPRAAAAPSNSPPETS